MTSRSAVVAAVGAWRWRDVRAGLEALPELAAYRDERGRNLLHLCCSVNGKKKRLAPRDGLRTAEVLLDAGFDVNAEAFREGDWKATPLWYAVARGESRALAELLLKRGSDPNHCLWAAAFRDDLDAIRLLIASGAKVDPVTENETPFLAAIKTSHFRAARALLEHGADPDFRDARGMTALHYMLKKGSDKPHFRMLVAHGARGDIPDARGETAGAILRRKRDSELQRMADRLRGGAAR